MLFLVSGVLLWLGERNTEFRFASTVLLHDGLMYVSLVLLAGHLYLAVLHPATRHALRGITLGTVDEEWAAKHHSEVDATIGRWQPFSSSTTSRSCGTWSCATCSATGSPRSRPATATTRARLIETREPSLVVLDVMLPGTDGLELCRWIRGRSDLPVILLTARGEEADRIVGLELGADDYVTKPFSPRELAVRVRTVLRRTNGAADAAAARSRSATSSSTARAARSRRRARR